jgi:HPt (histidine-containing phosphotransfer) domain-containing protein
MTGSISKDHIQRYIDEELFGEVEVFKELVRCFGDEIAELKSAGVDLKSMHQAAHKLKPTCETYGALLLARQLADLETSAKDKQLEKSIKLYQEILPHLETVLSQLKAI